MVEVCTRDVIVISGLPATTCVPNQIQQAHIPSVFLFEFKHFVSSKKNTTTTTVSTTTRTTTGHPSNRFCGCLKKLKPKSCGVVLCKWVSLFRCGYCENSRDLRDSPSVTTPRSRSRNAIGENGANEFCFFDVGIAKTQEIYVIRHRYCENSRDLRDSPPVTTPRSGSQNVAGENGEEDEHVTVEVRRRILGFFAETVVKLNLQKLASVAEAIARGGSIAVGEFIW
ncbi:hypothetical protein L6452_18473 [Arctium lappa]|uniref:Uncharacterized protein n=1 Tax=Arctium lappa TaxID=4217 RepID=A0ACB9C6A1_ARCLA|nr:hypothetical protein L6452_18473 [Arctium lappa]